MNKVAIKQTAEAVMKAGIIVASIAVIGDVLATGDTGLAKLAENVTATFDGLAKLMLGVSYVAGIGFFIGAIFKFKQHKDNPTQIPMGTPIALLVVAVCLVFLPYIIQTTGETLTGEEGDSLTGLIGGSKGAGITNIGNTE